MKQVFTCPSCRHVYQADTGEQGTVRPCPHCHAPVEVPRPGFGSGARIGGFTIKCLLGKGGMGEVYLARQESMERDVALKILPAGLTADPTSVKRFLQEVRHAACLEHARIVTAYEAGEEGGCYYLAMQYVRGESLDRYLDRKGRLPEAEALSITRAVAEGLAYAWKSHHLLHRDIKPGNIMLDQENLPRILDLGMSKTMNEGPVLTLPGTVLGTPNYMSPEQVRASQDTDFRSDIYSLGLTLYHMVTGTMPFAGNSVVETLQKQATEHLPDPARLAPGLSAGCVQVLRMMLAKDPADRYGSWDDLLSDLDRVLEGRLPAGRLSPDAATVLMQAETLADEARAATPPWPAPPSPPAAPVASAAPRARDLRWLLPAGVAALWALLFLGPCRSEKHFGPPQEVTSMTVAGNFNNWNHLAINMRRVDPAWWEFRFPFDAGYRLELKFVANGNWDFNWGENTQLNYDIPTYGTAEAWMGGRDVTNVICNVRRTGPLRIRFNQETFGYSIEYADEAAPPPPDGD